MMEFDLADLDNSVFEIHEEVICRESQLFRLDTHFDSVMKSNSRAKTDGVFRGRLSADLRKEKTNWEDFWKKAEGNKQKVTVQFLVAPDNPEARYCMEHVTTQLPGNTSAFLKTLQNPQTLENPTPTCCSEVLRKSGPQQAVKHFYEELISKCVVVPKYSRPAEDQAISYKKTKFNERQNLLLREDPSVVCALLEQSMTSKTYKVNDRKNTSDVNDGCKCHNCYIHRQSEVLNCRPENLKEDGSGRNCSLYIEEDSMKFLYITPNFALSHLCHVNMLTDVDSYYAGVLFPFVYVGGLHSFFPLHVEDMSLPSFNYMHMGHPKLWIVVAPCEVTKVSIILSNYGLHNVHRVCIFKLTHRSSVVFPQLLVHHDIKFKIIIQEPGDFIFLAPNAAHTGGNMGVNLAEACNVGTMEWLPYGSVASTQNCSCMEDKVHMDVTPLIKMHRKDLLKYHEGGTMYKNFNDPFFKRSIIGVHSIEPVQAASPLSAPASTSTKNSMTLKRARANCPVGECLKTYQIPLKRETLLTHIEQEHPQHIKKTKIIEAVDILCTNKRKGTGQRYECSDCGAKISVHSNRHKGSKACKIRSAKSSRSYQ